jgi:hypothetical protein
MGNLRRWSSSASGNSSVAGGANTINFAEGQAPGSVNNSAREMMAQVRGIYIPSEWGWVEFSATASVASQTTIKLTGNQTNDWTAGRRWRLKSGSSSRYGSIVSSSFTTETTITVSVDSGSLSASHSLAALAAIDSNHVPGFSDYARLATANTFTASQTINGGNPGLVLNGNTDFTPQVQAIHAGATAGSAAYCILNRARGTYSSPTIVSSGDVTGTFLFQGYDGANYRATGAIVGAVDGTPGASDMPGRLTFLTTPDGSASSFERMRIDSSGNVGIGTTTLNQQLQVGNSTDQAGLYQSGNVTALYLGGPSNTAGAGVFRVRYDRAGGSGYFVTGTTSAATDAIILNNSIFGPLKDGLGLGYSTGSGGTVTQLTSRTTGVTLNKTNGSITLFNAPNSTTFRSFTVTNSTVAATDVILLSQRSGTNIQQLIVSNVAAGSFEISHATTTGTTTEAPVINFAVIKAVTS